MSSYVHPLTAPHMHNNKSSNSCSNHNTNNTETTTLLRRTVPYLDGVEDYLIQLLQQASHAAETRDRLLEEVKAQVDEDSLVQLDLDGLQHFGNDVMGNFVQQTASLARVVRTNAAFAAHASVRAKQLNTIVQRAQAVRAVVQSMQAMSTHVKDIPVALARNDLDRAVSLIVAYEKAQRAVESDDEENRDVNDSVGDVADNSSNKDNNDKDDDSTINGTKRVAYACESDKSSEARASAIGGATADKDSSDKSIVAHARADVYARLARAADEAAAAVASAESNGGEEDRDTEDGARTTLKNISINHTSSPGKPSIDAAGRNHIYNSNNNESSGGGGGKDDLSSSAATATAETGVEASRQRMRHVCGLLAQLGFVEEARDRYCRCVSHSVTAALQLRVAEELRKMSDPQSAAMSHLSLVSHILDTVVAAFESQSAFTREQFGVLGVLSLLRQLHGCATAASVPVLRDFVTSRQDMLHSMSVTHSQGTTSARGHSGTTTANETSFPSTLSEDLASTRVAQARHVDRTLEDMSHLVSCCSLYLNFLSKQEREYSGRETSKKNGTETNDSKDNNNDSKHAIDGRVTNEDAAMWREDGNALVDAVQELLAMYVPLQREYFGIAFAQAVMLQETSIAQMDPVYAQRCARALRRNNNNNKDTNATFGDHCDDKDEDEDDSHTGEEVEEDANGGLFGLTSDRRTHSVRSTESADASSRQGNLTSSSPLAASPLQQGQHSANAGAACNHTSSSSSSSSILMAGLSSLYTAAARRVGGARATARHDDSSAWNSTTATTAAAVEKNRHARGMRGRVGSDYDDEHEQNATVAAVYSDALLTASAPERWLTLPDDVFFIARIALHRVVQIRSIQITSTVVMAVTELIQEKLVPYLEQHALHALTLCCEVAVSPVWWSTLSETNSSHVNQVNSALGRIAEAGYSRAAATGAASTLSLSSTSAAVLALPSVWTLRWHSAIRQSIAFADRLCTELEQLGRSHYTGRDVIRLRELTADVQHGATGAAQRSETWLREYAQRCHAVVMSSHLSQLARTRYTLDEETFYHLELHDSWVNSCVGNWKDLLRWWLRQLQPSAAATGAATGSSRAAHDAAAAMDMDGLVEPSVVQTIDALIRELALAVATSVRHGYGQHRYTAFGALQVDKEVRALRAVFVEAALDRSPYDAFQALTLMSTLLLCDHPQDAKEEVHNTALTSEEKIAVLLMRVDFDRDEVMKLRL